MNIRKFFVRRTIGFFVVLVIVGLVAAFYLLNSYIYKEKQQFVAVDYKNAEYLIEGKRIRLTDGFSEIDSPTDRDISFDSKITTRYFNNELKTDLNNDGREDVVFLLLQQISGNNVFFYAVAALNTESGWLGSDGYFLGDRIAVQTTEMSPNPRHKNVVVVNYADRAPGEPMIVRPSQRKSAYIKLDPESRQWGIVEPNFEGESNLINAN